jgi:hypothetical protein
LEIPEREYSEEGQVQEAESFPREPRSSTTSGLLPTASEVSAESLPRTETDRDVVEVVVAIQEMGQLRRGSILYDAVDVFENGLREFLYGQRSFRLTTSYSLALCLVELFGRVPDEADSTSGAIIRRTTSMAWAEQRRVSMSHVRCVFAALSLRTFYTRLRAFNPLRIPDIVSLIQEMGQFLILTSRDLDIYEELRQRHPQFMPVIGSSQIYRMLIGSSRTGAFSWVQRYGYLIRLFVFLEERGFYNHGLQLRRALMRMHCGESELQELGRCFVMGALNFSMLDRRSTEESFDMYDLGREIAQGLATRFPNEVLSEQEDIDRVEREEYEGSSAETIIPGPPDSPVTREGAFSLSPSDDFKKPQRPSKRPRPREEPSQSPSPKKAQPKKTSKRESIPAASKKSKTGTPEQPGIKGYRGGHPVVDRKKTDVIMEVMASRGREEAVGSLRYMEVFACAACGHVGHDESEYVTCPACACRLHKKGAPSAARSCRSANQHISNDAPFDEQFWMEVWDSVEDTPSSQDNEEWRLLHNASTLCQECELEDSLSQGYFKCVLSNETCMSKFCPSCFVFTDTRVTRSTLPEAYEE